MLVKAIIFWFCAYESDCKYFFDLGLWFLELIQVMQKMSR